MDTIQPYLSPRAERPPAFTAAVIAAVAVLLAGLVSVAALTASTTNSPADIVRDLLQATSTGNLSRAFDTLDPSERQAISPSLTVIVEDLKRIGLVDQTADLTNVSGIDATFRKVSMRTESLAALRPGLAAVVFTGGTADVEVTTSGLPLADVVKGVASKLEPGFRRLTRLGGPGSEARPLVTIQRNGAWYVSLGYTIAEQARRRAGRPLPRASASVPARGAVSPQALARALVTAATEDDLRTLVELTDPVEDAALHDYAPLFLRGRPAATKVAVAGLGLASTPVPGGTLVTVTDFTATVDGGDVVSLTAAGCFVLRHPNGTTQRLCEPAGSDLLAGYGIVAVRRGGGWFVDPYRSALDDLDHVISGLNLARVARLAHGDATAVLREIASFLGAAPAFAHLPFLTSKRPSSPRTTG